jgi:hypothetical protein
VSSGACASSWFRAEEADPGIRGQHREHRSHAEPLPRRAVQDHACIEWGNNVIGGRERAKHIDIRKTFAHEVFHYGQMRLVKVPTTAQMADILTKELHLPQV